MYEASGTIFWLSTENARWDGQPLAASGLTYSMVEAGRQMWSTDNYNRSSEDENKRRYMINGAIPTAVASMSDVPTCEEQKKTFIKLPIFATRGVSQGGLW